MHDVLCASDMCVDLVLSGNVRPHFSQVEQIIGEYSLELGGSANIFVSQFVKLGGRAGVIGRVGEDVFGKFALDRLIQLGVDASRVAALATVKTGLGVALAEPGDRAILTYPGTIDVLTGDDLGAELVDACCHWHIASYFLMGGLRGVWPGWLRRMKTAGRSTSLDPNWDPQERWDGVVEVLPYVEVFLPNEVEAMAISGATCVRDAAEWLAARGPVVVVKRGANGVLAAGPGWRQEFQALGPPDLAETVADAVGAGDNFDAGFLRGWLLGWSIEDSVHLGQRCAARSLGGAGGIAGQLVMNVDEEQRR